MNKYIIFKHEYHTYCHSHRLVIYRIVAEFTHTYPLGTQRLTPLSCRSLVSHPLALHFQFASHAPNSSLFAHTLFIHVLISQTLTLQTH